MKPIKQVDKNTKYMSEAHGTTCLITEPGKADRLLDLARKRRLNQERMVPIDAWDI